MEITLRATNDTRAVVFLRKIISGFDRFNPLIEWVGYGVAVLLFIFMCFIFSDVLLRYVFNRPIPFSTDISGMFLAAFVFLGLGYVQLKKHHMRIDLLINRLSPQLNLTISVIIYNICTVATGLIFWRSISNAIEFYVRGTIGVTGMSLFPHALLMPIGALLFLIVFLRDTLSQIIDGIQIHFSAIRWFFVIIVTVFWIAVSILLTQQIFADIDPVFGSVLAIFLALILMFLGMPIALALLVLAFMMIGNSLGLTTALMVPGSILYSDAVQYGFSVIPLFTLMSYLIMASGLGSDAYFAASKWFGHLRGGLATATIGGSAALASVVGTGVASTVVMGNLAFPEMRKFKYSDNLATGCIVAGATLGPMIPPSMGFIMYGILAGESIGRLFIAGIVPGLMLIAVFIAIIIISCRINPNLGPATEKSDWPTRLVQLPRLTPIACLFLIIIGGIYLGFFSAMEAGGIGAFMALVIGLAMGRMKWQSFKDAMVKSMEFSSLMLFVIATGIVFGGGLGASGLSAKLVEFSYFFEAVPNAFVAIILFIYLLFGVFCDAPIIQILTTPILVPILRAMGVDILWFGVVSVLIINLGTITPPYAMGIFMLRAVVGEDVPISAIFRGAIPFCLGSLLVAAILFFLPDISRWLPDLMM